jgi:UDP-glucose 4-epimerase
MRILVTGGFGFIGSHLCERLILEGHEVHILDSSSTGNIRNIQNIQGSSALSYSSDSILNRDILVELIKNSDYIFHLAAAVGVFNIVNKPLESLLTNIRGTENVLEIASRFKVPVFFTSSSEVYGKNIANSLKEDDDRIIGSPTVLRWTYSEAKAIDESLAYAYHLEENLEVRIVRFFNTVGPRQVGSYGMVIPRFVKSALENQPITVYGDGNQTRCFAHVLDVVDAIFAVAFADSTVGKVLNIGNDFEISMNDLARRIVTETNSKSHIVHVPYEVAYGEGFEDMERRVPNIDLIGQLVGWKPKRDLSTIISDIVKEMNKSY